MEYTQELSLELNSNTAYSTVGAKQGDSGSRVVKVFVTENGIDYNLNEHEVTSAYFRMRKPDGKAIINTATISKDGSYLSIVLTAQALAVAGRGYADITLMSGSQILSTISFIILIMASPAVAGQATSSNEFGYLNAVVEDATHTIYEAEAWAAGTRGNIPVYSETGFLYSYDSDKITFISVDQTEFFKKVGSKPGLKREFVFTYTTDDNWSLVLSTIEGNDTSVYNPEIISSINDYGIILGLLGGVETPDAKDTITVIIEEADKTYENNAKFYSEHASLERNRIESLTVSAESSINPNVFKQTISDSVDLTYLASNISNVTVNEEQFLTKINYDGAYMQGIFTFTYKHFEVNELNNQEFNAWELTSIYNTGIKTITLDPVVINNDLSSYGITYTIVQGEIPALSDQITITVQGHYNLHFFLPKGETGNINLMTMYVDTDITSATYGQVIVVQPDSMLATDFINYPENIVLNFDRTQFLQYVGIGQNMFKIYNFIYKKTQNNWYLNDDLSQSINLANYGITYQIKPGYQLENNETIRLRYIDQVKFSISDTGDLIMKIETGGI